MRTKRAAEQCHTVLQPDHLFPFYSRLTAPSAGENVRPTAPGPVSEPCRLLTRNTPAPRSEFSQQSGLHRCRLGAHPGTLATPKPPPPPFFLTTTRC